MHAIAAARSKNGESKNVKRGGQPVYENAAFQRIVNFANLSPMKILRPNKPK